MPTTGRGAKPVYEALRFEKNDNTVEKAQHYLLRLGLYEGVPDGRFGPLTRKAIRLYQKQNGLTVDGKLSQRVMAHLTNNITTRQSLDSNRVLDLGLLE